MAIVAVVTTEPSIDTIGLLDYSSSEAMCCSSLVMVKFCAVRLQFQRYLNLGYFDDLLAYLYQRFLNSSSGLLPH